MSIFLRLVPGNGSSELGLTASICYHEFTIWILLTLSIFPQIKKYCERSMISKKVREKKNLSTQSSLTNRVGDAEVGKEEASFNQAQLGIV